VPGGDAPSLLARADLIVALGLDPTEPAAPEPGGVPWLCLGCAQSAPGSSRVDGGVAPILEELAPRLRDRPRADWDVALLDRLKRATPASAPGPTENRTGRVIGLVRRWTPGGTIATAEWGFAATALRQWACVGPGELLVPGVPAIRPFAVEAAAAAQLARPDSCVVGFAGVGDLARGELETVRRLGLPVVVIVTPGADAEGTRSGVESPGAADVADERELEAALDRALSHRRPAVIDASGIRVVHP
jgi:thiamine pyrophosphate-dependent acetolactate synthase large subunit-like protein